MAKNIEEIKAALAAYGITGVKDVYYNPSYEQLFKDEMDPALTGYDKGTLTELDTVNVMTGIYTGRSPKDKYIVMDKNSKDTVWCPSFWSWQSSHLDAGQSVVDFFEFWTHFLFAFVVDY